MSLSSYAVVAAGNFYGTESRTKASSFFRFSREFHTFLMAKAAQCRNQDKGLFGLHLYLSLIETTSQGLKITQNVSLKMASEASYVFNITKI